MNAAGGEARPSTERISVVRRSSGPTSDENARNSTSSSVKAIGPSKGMNPARTLGSTGNHKGNVPERSFMIPAHQLGAIRASFLIYFRHFCGNHVRQSHAKLIFVCLKSFETVYGSARSSARSQDFGWKKTFLPGRVLELRLARAQLPITSRSSFRRRSGSRHGV